MPYFFEDCFRKLKHFIVSIACGDDFTECARESLIVHFLLDLHLLYSQLVFFVWSWKQFLTVQSFEYVMCILGWGVVIQLL